VYSEETHCWLCGEWVDQTLHWLAPMARSVDHVVELWQGGDPQDRNNCRLAHRRCNTRKSNQLRAGTMRQQFSVDISTI
jgi:5-methylcytosine-specific restriction endonuclease McrA